MRGTDRDKAFTENTIYQHLLSDKLATNLGYIYEIDFLLSRITNERYLIYTKDYAKEGAMRYVPTYLGLFL